MNIDNNLAKYKLVKNYYLNYIKDKNLIEGDLLPSESEVSNKFNFSRDTVRRALNELEKEGYVKRKRGKGTFYVKPKRQKKIKKVAVLTTYVSDYIFPSIISGIEEIVSSKNFTLTFASTNNDPAFERKHLKRIIDSEVDGLIIEPTKSAGSIKNKDLYLKLNEKKIPYVMINAMYKELDPAYVILDDLKGGYMATKYLLQLGHRNLAGIFKIDDLQGIYRKKGFLRALKEYGVDLEKVTVGEYTTEEITTYPYYFTDKLINSSRRPTAIVCYNDEISLKVIEAIENNNLSIPDDISIVGYDDSILSTIGSLKLTTIKHPKTKMGKQAARMLFNMIDGVSDKPSYIYEPELIVRTSCKEIK